MHKQQEKCYNDNWKSNKPSRSWAVDVLDDIDGNGGIYLSKINDWFQKYPDKSDLLKKRLESHENDQHLGAVNELFWYNLALNLGWELNPLPAINKKGFNTPDFEVKSPTSFYCEITTLTIPKNGKRFEFENELERIFGKSQEKQKQFKIGHQQQKPNVLVIFDYSTFSGLGTQHQKSLPDFLSNPPTNFGTMPSELSALLYLERYFEEGKFKLRMSKSVIFYNPAACLPIEKKTFDWLDQKTDLHIE